MGRINYLRDPIEGKPHSGVRWSVHGACKSLIKADYLLVKEWLTPEDNTDNKLVAKMLCARMAEKITEAYYHDMGYEVNDISITQIKEVSGDWRKCDLKLKKGGLDIYIDVKNARSAYYNKKRFSDHDVKQFKKDCNGKDVYVTAVMSPYLTLEQIKGRDKIYEDNCEFLVLGETNLALIDYLQKQFTTETFKVQILKNQNSLLPVWCFDYYINKSGLRKDTNRLPLNALARPDEQYSAIFGINKELPISWKNPTQSQLTFIERLHKYAKIRISLPILYLTVLQDFFEKIINHKEGFHPNEYSELLFIPGYIPNEPLGIKDPLGLIEELIRSLTVITNHSNLIDWSQIEFINLKGEDYITARKTNGEILTLIAYCGGKLLNKLKCGNSPLIIGSHQNCPICGKLICDKCGFCSDNCSRNNSLLVFQNGSHLEETVFE